MSSRETERIGHMNDFLLYAGSYLKSIAQYTVMLLNKAEVERWS